MHDSQLSGTAKVVSNGGIMVGDSLLATSMIVVVFGVLYALFGWFLALDVIRRRHFKAASLGLPLPFRRVPKCQDFWIP